MSPEEVQKPQKRRRRARKGQTQRKRLLHAGLHARRCRSNPHEAAFAKAWWECNDRSKTRGLNDGFGRLQDLLIGHEPGSIGLPWRNRWFHFLVCQRDAVIVATVIQWLGSPVGIQWLFGVLKSCGYEVRQVRKPAGIPAQKGDGETL